MEAGWKPAPRTRSITMKATMKKSGKSAKEKIGIRVKAYFDEKNATHVTEIRIRDNVEVATIDGYICFWIAGREVRIGPITPEQAEKLSDDLGYDAVA
jgi:hypothetical protein